MGSLRRQASTRDVEKEKEAVQAWEDWKGEFPLWQQQIIGLKVRYPKKTC